LRCNKDRTDVDGKGAVEVSELDVFDWADHQRAGVVDQDIDAAQSSNRLLDR